jgi:hypothetical protein
MGCRLGPRWNEAIGFRVCDLNPLREEVSFGRVVVNQNGGQTFTKELDKTDEHRTVPCPIEVMNALVEHIALCCPASATTHPCSPPRSTPASCANATPTANNSSSNACAADDEPTAVAAADPPGSSSSCSLAYGRGDDQPAQVQPVGARFQCRGSGHPRPSTRARQARENARWFIQTRSRALIPSRTRSPRSPAVTGLAGSADHRIGVR